MFKFAVALLVVLLVSASALQRFTLKKKSNKDFMAGIVKRATQGLK
jgi:hypothetical protein